MSIELRGLLSILSMESIFLVIFIVVISKAVQRLRKAKRNQEIQDGFGCEKITATLEGYKTEHHGKGSVHSHPIYAYDNNGEKATLVSVLTEPVPSQDKIGKKVEEAFVIDWENSVDKRALIKADSFGYLSLHYISTF